MARPPFDMLRAAFILLAILMIVQLISTVAGGLICFWFNYSVFRQLGACMPSIQVIREQWSEMITAVLALLLAGRGGPSPPPGGNNESK